jgi:ribosomal protein L37AE/L43A
MSETAQRTVPYYCPYCGGEDLRPSEEAAHAWECRECTRVFGVTFVGLLNPSTSKRSD